MFYMKIKKLNCVLILILAVVLLFCFSGCAKKPGVQGGDFKEHSSLSAALSAQGNTTVSLSRDETMDLTGININGRKEIFLNNYTLKLIGHYCVTEKGVLDIKPGEEFSEGVIDLSELRFDISEAPAEVSDELPLIEIRPEVTIIEPQMGGDIGIHEFPGVLTVIAFRPAG